MFPFTEDALDAASKIKIRINIEDSFTSKKFRQFKISTANKRTPTGRRVCKGDLEKGKYYGNVVDGEFHGHGIFEFSNGDEV